LLVKFLPLAELSSTVELTVGGQTCLALTLATVVFWACGVAQPGFVGLLYCALLVLFKVCVDDTGAASISATVASTFSSWTKATMWLVIGAYLIASAVKESGLGERIAYAFMLKFVRDAKSLIISIFALTFVLSLLIPPLPALECNMIEYRDAEDCVDYYEAVKRRSEPCPVAVPGRMHGKD